ncbi:MAG: DUF4373 domain-containing protein [Alistipes sp.]|nr:DUF4373 domain-containing protein [Alistipes sp.]
MYNYLPHPSNMRTSSHVLRMRIREGAAGYGVYMMLLETLRDADGRRVFNFPEGLAFAINEPDVDLVKRVIEEYGLFNLDKEGFITSPWLDAQMAEYDAKKAAAAEAGRRGAAKRYGKKTEAAPENGDPIGGAMGSLKEAHSNKPNPNIINSTEINPTTSKSRLLGLTWGKWSGEELFLIARQRGTIFSPLDREEAAIRATSEAMKPEPEYNHDLPVQLADAMGLTHEQYEVVADIIGHSKIGTPRLREAVRILNAWTDKSFRAKYPFEHLICSLLDPQ